MKVLLSKITKRFRFEIAIDYQINIGVSCGKPWSGGDERFYIWIDFLCFNSRISILK